MAEAFERRGYGATKSPGSGLGVNFFAKSWVEGYDDSSIWNVVDGNGYEIYKKTNQLTQKTGVDRMFGGNWIGAVNADVPFCQFPINIDVDLNGKRDISGVRIYTAATNNGYIKAYKVYVNYGGQDNGWHYIYTGNTSSKADLTADFGFNVTAAKVRISVTDISKTTGSAITSSGGEYTIPAGTPIYFFIDGVTVLQPKAGYVNATVEKKDDEIAIDAAKLKGYFGNGAAESVKQLMDGYSDKSVMLNGKATLDFGEQVTFSGFRYYPPADATKKVAPLSFNIDRGVTLYSAVNSEGALTGEQSMRGNGLLYEDYTDYNSDPTKPITVYFKKNITARGIRFDIWHTVEVGNSKAESPHAGEIRLIKAREGYPDMSKVVEFEQTPEVIDHGMTKEGAGDVWWIPSCLFDKYIYTKDGEFGKNATTDADYYVGFGTYGADAGFMSEEKAWLTIDLKQETDFSAVRLFGRMCYAMSPTDVNLYFSNDNKKWTLASHNTDSLTDKKIDDMFCYSKSGDIYTDMKPNDGDSNYSVRARYIKIEILKAGNSDYAALSEIMLVKPGNNVLSVDELNKKIAENSVKLEITSAESGIYPATEATAATGIIRFITKFNDIKEGTTVEEFGTYVITNENYNKNSDLSRYSDAFASYKNATPEVGDAFSVDVTNIAETNWNTPVVAISFVKIEGYNNLIISGIKLLDKVDSANELSK